MKHKDKYQHFIISFVLAALVYGIWRNEWWAIIVPLAIGGIKKVIDRRRGTNTHRESWADMLVDVIGIVVGIYIVKLFL